jgi:hypothetical protein
MGRRLNDQEASVMRQSKHSIESHRYELVHGEDADFIAYQRPISSPIWRDRADQSAARVPGCRTRGHLAARPLARLHSGVDDTGGCCPNPKTGWWAHQGSNLGPDD